LGGNNNIAVLGQLRQAFDAGINLVYLFSPYIFHGGVECTSKYTLTQHLLPGIKVDDKTTYKSMLSSFSHRKMLQTAFREDCIKISSYPKSSHVFKAVRAAPSSPRGSTQVDALSALLSLAIAAGEWSRFKTDSNLPRTAMECMYAAWLTNSVNRSLADEVFVALDTQGASSLPP
jgi:hypothetical protein